MAWDFSTEPEFQEKLDWMRAFVRTEVFPLETIDWTQAQWKEVTAPLKQQVRDRGLWAAHLPPELGGMGLGLVHLGLMYEIIGMSDAAAEIFGNPAPDSGNAVMMAPVVTEDQRTRWLQPLLNGDIRSAFSMTEPAPGAGADPTMLRTTAVRDGNEWVIKGHKWFTSNGSIADFLIVMCVTNPEAGAVKGASLIIVPANTAGVEIVRDIPNMDHPGRVTGWYAGKHTHTEIMYRDVRVPYGNILGAEGQGFALAQARLGPARVHRCMEWIGQCHRAFDMLCEYALTREAFGGPLSDKQIVQAWVADSAAQISAARLMVLNTAWQIEQHGAQAVRADISLIKVFVAQVLHDVVDRAVQVHGSLGMSGDMPLEEMYRATRRARIIDGPDEVHRQTAARLLLKGYRPSYPPTEHVPTRRAAALEQYGDFLRRTGGER